MEPVPVLPDEPHMPVFARSLSCTAHAPVFGAIRREDGEFIHHFVESHHEASVGKPLDVERQSDHGFAVDAEDDIGDQFDGAGLAEILGENGDFLGGGRPRDGGNDE